MASHDLVVLGDVNMDYVVARDLSFPLSSVVEDGLIYWEDIDEVPGGSGLNFCAFAADAGYTSLMLGKVGSDSAGQMITNWLTARGVAMPPRWTATGSTGKAFIMRDSNGIRVIVNNRDNVNRLLSVADIDESTMALSSCLVIYVSGYCIMDSNAARFDAARRAMSHAQSGSSAPIVVFDVVPHRIYEQMSFEEFRANTEHVDILISEIGTMRRFLGLGSRRELIDEEIARETAQMVADYYPRAALRYGRSGCDYELLMDVSAESVVHHATGHRHAVDKRGYGDRLALSALQSFFRVLPINAPASRSPLP